MSRHYLVRPTHPLDLQARVAAIEPAGTAVTVVGPDIEPTVITSEEIFDAEGASGLRVVATSSANITVTYLDEVEKPKAVRGDTGGTGGGLEARTLDELYAESKRLDVDGRSSMDKDELIAAIRAAE